MAGTDPKQWGTCYGLSAAVGKAGAAIGTEIFTPIQDNLGKR